jgi:uncharacterized protein
MAFDTTVFVTRFLGIFIEAAPFLLLGTFASGLIEAFVTQDDIVRLIPKNPVLAILMGVMMGFAFPVCECGVVPVVRRLIAKGLPVSVGITFLMAAPVMNPVVVASTYTAFGLGPVFYGRYLMTALVAALIGLVFAAQTRPHRILRVQSVMLPISGGSEAALPLVIRRKALLPGLKDAVLMAQSELFEMGRYLILGSILAALMGTFAIDKSLEGLATNPVNSVLVMQATAFVLSICSTVDAFLALSFSRSFTTGSILAFLTFGPMVDIKSTLMFLGVFKRRVVFYMIALAFLLPAAISIALNLNVRF